MDLGVIDQFFRRDRYTVCWNYDQNDTTADSVVAGYMTFGTPYACTLGKVCVLDYNAFDVDTVDNVFDLKAGTSCSGANAAVSGDVEVVDTVPFYQEEVTYVHLNAHNATRTLDWQGSWNETIAKAKGNYHYIMRELDVYDKYNKSHNWYSYNYSDTVRDAVLGVNETSVAANLKNRLIVIPLKAGVYSLCRNSSQ